MEDPSKSSSAQYGNSKAYAENYQRIFGKKETNINKSTGTVTNAFEYSSDLPHKIGPDGSLEGFHGMLIKEEE